MKSVSSDIVKSHLTKDEAHQNHMSRDHHPLHCLPTPLLQLCRGHSNQYCPSPPGDEWHPMWQKAGHDPRLARSTTFCIELSHHWHPRRCLDACCGKQKTGFIPLKNVALARWIHPLSLLKVQLGVWNTLGATLICPSGDQLFPHLWTRSRDSLTWGSNYSRNYHQSDFGVRSGVCMLLFEWVGTCLCG